jgi:hypothetical protein
MSASLLHSGHRTPLGKRCVRSLRRLAVLALLLAVGGVALKYWSFDRIDDEVRRRVEQELAARFPHLAVRVKSARRVQGKGIEVRGIRLFAATSGQKQVLAEVDEVLAECDTHFPDFVTHTPVFRAIHVRGLKLHARRQPDGGWNLAQLVPASAAAQSGYPPVTIEDGELEVVDPQRGRLSLRNIELQLEPRTKRSAGGELPLLALRGTLAGDHVENVEMEGLWDAASGEWELRGAVEGLEFTPRLRATMPTELAEMLAPLSSIRGRTHFGFRVTRQLPAGAEAPASAARTTPTIDFEVDGKIAEGRIDDARLPDPLTEVEATIHCDRTCLRIGDLSARCGQTIIESLSAELHGLAPGSPLTLSLSARQVDLARLPIAHFPAAVRESWARFSPRGRIDLSGKLHFDGQAWHPQLTAQCLDLSLEYDRFRYRVTDGTGTIALYDDRLTADLRFLAGSQTITCKADVLRPGPDFSGEILLASSEPLLIDERMIAALEPRQQQIVRDFHPRGSVGMEARIWREPRQARIHRRVALDLHEVAILYDRFRYTISDVSGTLLLEDERWIFRNLAGRNDSAQIAGSGHWNSAAGPEATELVLTFTASSVPLEDELRQALLPAVQRLWKDLRPRGTLDQVAVRLRYRPAAGELEVEVDAHKLAGSGMPPISVEPEWFRYRMEDITGDFFYTSRSGTSTLRNVRAAHGKTKIAAEGTCQFQADGGCTVRLTKLIADRVQPDHELLSALPGGIGQRLSRLEIAGPVQIEGELGISAPPKGQPVIDWNLLFDLENGSLRAGVPIEHVHGQMRLSGQSDGRTLLARGELAVDSALVRGVQLTQIKGPLWIDSQRLLAGTRAERAVQGRSPRWITANALDGQMALEGELHFADGSFQVEASLENADLRRVAEQLCPAQRNVTGTVFGATRLAGTTQGVHTWRGDGQVRLKDADIYELPLMVSLLKLLAIQRPDRTAFTNSNMEFQIEGDELEFTQIDFEGDAITLKGRGRMNGQQEVDLKFYTQLGRDEMQLPLFRPVLGEINRQFLLIEVTGSLDHPHVTKTAFPRLNDQLSQLFPELARLERERASLSERDRPLLPGNLLPRGGLWPRNR